MITIKKAIEILSDSANAGMTTFNQDYKDAQRLGIEALKERAEAKRRGLPLWHELLPGETEE